MSQKVPADGFKWIKEDDLSKFNESFKTVIRDVFDVDVEYPKLSELPFLPERIKINKCNKLVLLYKIKETMLLT